VIDYSSGRGQIGPTIHSEDYEVFLLYIIKFNTDLGRICFCFGGVLGGVTMVLEESSTFVACLHKQIPFGSFLDDVRKQPPMTP
jgi:hypothetical protein